MTNEIFRYGVVPVVVLDEVASAAPLAKAMIAGGLPVAEVTFRTAAAADSIRAMRDIGAMTVGAGTVVTPAQVDEAYDAGATFIVSPGVRVDVVRRAQELGLPVLPGAVTPTEIMACQELGLDTVKFFPATVYGGVAGIRALAAPFGGMRFVPTGGVTPETIGHYLSLSCVPAVGASGMVPAAVIRAGNFAEITRLCAEAVDVASKYV